MSAEIEPVPIEAPEHAGGNEAGQVAPDWAPSDLPTAAPDVEPGLEGRAARGGRLTPINRRRLAVFRRHRRGFWSAIAFAVIFTVSLFSEVIANDRPILISYRGEWLSPL